jgi:protein phosphatase
LLDGDAFVICSDGLTRHVADREILSRASNGPAQQACDTLISLALDRGGIDNVTVVIMRYRLQAPPNSGTEQPDHSDKREW